MTYDPKKNVIQITPEQARRAYDSLRWAMKHIRLASGRPLDRHEHHGPLESVDFAQSDIMDAAKDLGIDMGAAHAEELDPRDIG